MTAVIKNNVYIIVRVKDGFYYIRISLASYEYLYSFFFVLFAFGIYINAYYSTSIPKVIFPHRQRAAAEDSDLYENWLIISKSREMPLIYVKIVHELV